MGSCAKLARTAAHVDVVALLTAVAAHEAELQAWLHTPPMHADGDFLRGRDLKLVDFSPLESWGTILRLCAEAEVRGKGK
jgi:hypothetical protein